MMPQWEVIRLDQIADSPVALLPTDNAFVEGLAESIQNLGLVEPLVVRTLPSGYEMIAGHARAMALRKLGHDTAPAIVKNLDDSSAWAAVAAASFVRQQRASDFDTWRQLVKLESSGAFKTNRELASALGRTPSELGKLRAFAKLPNAALQILGAHPTLVDMTTMDNLVSSGLIHQHGLVTSAITQLAIGRIKRPCDILAWISKRAVASGHGMEAT